MSDKLFLDTNVLVYAYDALQPDKQRIAQEVIAHGVETDTIAVSAQCLSEFYVTVTRKIPRPLSVASALDVVDRLSLLQVIELDSTLVREAIVLHAEQQVSYWDALIIAAAARGGCDTVLSEDLQHGRQYGDVTVRNPFTGA